MGVRAFPAGRSDGHRCAGAQAAARTGQGFPYAIRFAAEQQQFHPPTVVVARPEQAGPELHGSG